MKKWFQRCFSILFILIFIMGMGAWTNPAQVVRAAPRMQVCSGPGPAISVWYGLTQSFGSVGNPQGQIGVLGNVAPGATLLTYTLNGGSPVSLRQGPDGRRLSEAGDFVVELFDYQLSATNTVVITSSDGTNTCSETVIVNYQRDNKWYLPYNITSWAGGISSKAQVVDGKWEVSGTEILTTIPGYDRLVALGDMGWQDYEVTAEITPLGIDTVHCTGYVCAGESGTPAIGLIARWTGHTDEPEFPGLESEPKSGWMPLGAIGWYRWDGNGYGGLGIYHDTQNDNYVDEPSELNFGTKYLFTLRVETMADGHPKYSLKYWPSAGSEPSEWGITWEGTVDDPRGGSVILFAHHVNAKFGKVWVTEINQPEEAEVTSDDFNKCAVDGAVWTLTDPVDLAHTTATISGGFTNDASLNIAIAGGAIQHNPSVNNNTLARLTQTVEDKDLYLGAKFTSPVSQAYQMQGIMVEGTSASDFMRFEFFSDGAGTYIYGRAYSGTSSTTFLEEQIGPAGVSPLYMEVVRVGDRWVVGYSSNGTAWAYLATFPHLITVAKVGVYAGNGKNGSNPAPTHTTIVDYFWNLNDSDIIVDDTGVNDITITKVGNGNVAANPDKTVYTCGESVVLTADADTGSVFDGWSGDLVSTNLVETVVMNGPKAITATFSLDDFALTVAKNGTGSGTVTSNVGEIICGATCSANYEYGSTVILTAVAQTGSTFGGWSGGGCSGTGTCTVLVDQAKTVTATFTLGTNVLTVVKTGTGSGMVSSIPSGINCGTTCSFNFPFNTQVTLSAGAQTGSTFTGWSGSGCSGTGTCVVTMDDIKTVTAEFTLNEYTLSVAKMGDGFGTVTSVPSGINCGATCSADYDYNSQVTLTAVATPGSTFVGWSEPACTGTGSCTITITGDKSVSAIFVLGTNILAVTKTGTGNGIVTSSPGGISCGVTCAANFTMNTVVTLTAIPADGSTFNGWSGSGCSGVDVCVVTMNEAKTVTATFGTFDVADFKVYLPLLVR